jgi:hypothetical protein
MKRYIKTYGTKPKQVISSTARNSSTGNAFHTFKRNENRLVSHLDRTQGDYDNDHWNFDRNGMLIYTC